MINRKTISALLLAIAGSTSALAQTGPVVWDDNGNTYQFLFANINWAQARAAAENSVLPDGRAGHLVTITSAAENDFVANLFGGDFRAWIGLTDEVSEGNFQWITGEPVSYTRWSPGEPNNAGGNEDYVELFSSNDSWNDRPVTQFAARNASYIIEWEAVVNTLVSIAIIPDTQIYVEQNPEIFEAQIDWIIANQATENIIYVAHLGDLKDDRHCDVKTVTKGNGDVKSEWEIVDEAFDELDAARIPYGVVPGNHDFDSISGNASNGCPNWTTERPLVDYNTNFGPARFAGETWYGDPGAGRTGNRVVGSNADNFTLFDSGGVEFIAINLAYRQAANEIVTNPADPLFDTCNNAELPWADALLKAYPGRLGIVTTHYFLEQNPDVGDGGARNVFGPYGQCVYDNLSDNANLFMMLSAHERGEAWRVEDRCTDDMQPVHVLLSDYQSVLYQFSDGDPTTPPDEPNIPDINFSNLFGDRSNPGDSGFMRIMRFDTTDDMVNISTFIPPVPFLGRMDTIVSTYTPADGSGMDKDTASDLSISFAGYVDGSGCAAAP